LIACSSRHSSAFAKDPDRSPTPAEHCSAQVARDQLKKRAPHNGMIVRFADKDTALAWYNSPTYQALLDIRSAALDCRIRLVG
jgi:antibiotic biosynthesis monooxygenase (ABM) superfamily enzyme